MVAFSKLAVGGGVFAALVVALTSSRKPAASPRRASAAAAATPKAVTRERHGGHVNKAFFTKLVRLLRICVPGARTPEMFYLIALGGFLVTRTYILHIYHAVRPSTET